MQVTCYAGHTYAERPLSLMWHGALRMVKDVQKEWREPGERHFRVLTEDDNLIELCYSEEEDRWSAAEWLSNRTKERSDEQGSS